MENESELVDCEFACPNCGNRTMDDLIWVDDDTLKCTHCQTVFDPLRNLRKDQGATEEPQPQ